MVSFGPADISAPVTCPLLDESHSGIARLPFVARHSFYGGLYTKVPKRLPVGVDNPGTFL